MAPGMSFTSLEWEPFEWATTIRTEDGSLLSDADGQMARRAEYFEFEQLFTVDPPSGQLQTAGL
ncbi:hypothetical protein E2C01_094924 [Portunus trituberculatus]|uniref:Uncharacterized protein n=1 Tax=Portunus trituberculatus TaxID=210409 RepID=A0A5B7JYV6_PORTR|nr:hypothetical protein [Portunus trituberculatus]